jgi:nucleotide-binding universal stress UspA family protein
MLKTFIMKTLIAATDFSKASLNAVNYAADLAAAINAKLEVLHVMQVPVATVISDDIYGLEEEVYEQRTHKLQLLKQRLEKRTANRIPIACSVIEGRANSTIKDLAEDKKPLAIILGSKGVSNLQSVVFGSVALYTAKHSQFPVLLIPEKVKFKSISLIAFATDLFLENSTQLLKDLRKWLNIFNAGLDVVHVNDIAGFKKEKEDQFASFKQHLKPYDVYFNYVVNYSVSDGISSYIKTKKPDLLVLTYHKKDFLGGLTSGIEFGNILRDTAIPMLVMPD